MCLWARDKGQVRVRGGSTLTKNEQANAQKYNNQPIRIVTVMAMLALVMEEAWSVDGGEGGGGCGCGHGGGVGGKGGGQGGCEGGGQGGSEGTGRVVLIFD